MFKFKAALGGCALLANGAVLAATGNVGVYSEYMFRGVEQSAGAAVQGGLDYSHSSGLYAGTWISNTHFAGVVPGSIVGSEVDAYAGLTHSFGSLSVDVGAILYYYADAEALNTVEYYVGGTLGPVSTKAYYTEDYFGTGEEGLYVAASYAHALGESLTLTPQVGISTGNGPQAFVVSVFDTVDPDEHYLDYSLSLSKVLEGGFTFSFAVSATDLEGDSEKFVVGLKKGFDL